MTPSIFCRIPFLKFSILLTFIVFFVGSIPFAHALEIHHLFAEIDHDAHQHSEFDLCQWVKKHTSNTLVWDLPRVSHGSIGILSFLSRKFSHLRFPFWFPLLFTRSSSRVNFSHSFV